MRKICSKCLIEKDVCEFHYHIREKDGRYYQCKECRKIISKKEYHTNRKNKKIVINSKTCSICLIEKGVGEFHKHISSKDGYRSVCKKCRSDKFKYNYNNFSGFSETHKKRVKNYSKNNHEKLNEYYKKRYIRYPHIYAWRSMLGSVIRRLGSKKESSTYDILGYSAVELKNHLENLFTEGMSWDNWGKWHIDHIIPVSKFEKGSDPKIVNSLNNLQPLWATDNIRKGND